MQYIKFKQSVKSEIQNDNSVTTIRNLNYDFDVKLKLQMKLVVWSKWLYTVVEMILILILKKKPSPVVVKYFQLIVLQLKT